MVYLAGFVVNCLVVIVAATLMGAPIWAAYLGAIIYAELVWNRASRT